MHAEMKGRTSGLALRLQRTAKDVKAIDLARVMDVTPGWVSRIESRRVVPEETATKYLDALATFATVATPPEAA